MVINFDLLVRRIYGGMIVRELFPDISIYTMLHMRAILAKPLATLPPRLGCDPTSLMLDGTYYFDLYKVCNVNNKTKLLPMRAEYGLGNGFKGKAFIKI